MSSNRMGAAIHDAGHGDRDQHATSMRQIMNIINSVYMICSTNKTNAFQQAFKVYLPFILIEKALVDATENQ